jgi:hypothetical protein
MKRKSHLETIQKSLLSTTPLQVISMLLNIVDLKATIISGHMQAQHHPYEVIPIL